LTPNAIISRIACGSPNLSKKTLYYCYGTWDKLEPDEPFSALLIVQQMVQYYPVKFFTGCLEKNPCKATGD
jgi:hypothetical protein